MERFIGLFLMMIFALLFVSMLSGKAEKLGANLMDNVMKTGFRYWDTGKVRF